MNDNNVYRKPKRYKTVRYPLSGLVGTEEAKKKTEEHNSKFQDAKKIQSILTTT